VTKQNKTHIQPLLHRLDYLKEHFHSHYPKDPVTPVIIISISEQRLFLMQGNKLISSFAISSAKAGIGNLLGSYQTPLGVHFIAEKIGDNAPLGNIFKGRINTGEIARILTEKDSRSTEDLITSRILWLSGLQAGINKGGNIDTYKRYIYIHGTQEEGQLESPASHGCIRMANQAVIDLFEQVNVGTLVDIVRDLHES